MTDKKLLERFECTQTLNSDFYLHNGLKGGKMGAIIFFFHCSRETGVDKYEEIAEHLLDDIYQNLSQNIPLDFVNGLSGIGWGIEYLLQHGFVEGEADEILSEIDEYIIDEINRQHMAGLDLERGVVGLGRYILMRLRTSWRHGDTYASLALKENLIYLIDWIEKSLNAQNKPTNELVDLLQDIRETGFYKSKTEQIIQDFAL